MAELEQGTLFAGYRIGQILGRGGMGVVYEATEIALDRRVALKLIAADAARDEAFREQFERESRVAAKVDDPHVIPIYTVGREAGTLFIAMRLVPGRDLGEKLARRRLESAEAARLISQVAEGLDAIHESGLIHRDVKPSNILLAGDDGSEHAYVADFGLAKQAATSSGLTRQGRVVGTIDYVSPEQIEQRQVDARADVYSLGCVLYKMLTGRIPFERDTDAAKLWAHVHEDPRPPSALGGVPGAFDRVIERAMAKRPEDRYPSAGDLGRAAVAAAEGREVSASERWVATGVAAGEAPRLMLENQEGTTGDLARRYAHEEETPRLGARAPGSPRRRLRVPRVLVFALLGAAVGVGVFLVERPGRFGSLTPAEADDRPGRRDLHREPRSLQRGGLPAGRDVRAGGAPGRAPARNLGVGVAPASPSAGPSGGRRRMVGLSDAQGGPDQSPRAGPRGCRCG